MRVPLHSDPHVQAVLRGCTMPGLGPLRIAFHEIKELVEAGGVGHYVRLSLAGVLILRLLPYEPTWQITLHGKDSNDSRQLLKILTTRAKQLESWGWTPSLMSDFAMQRKVLRAMAATAIRLPADGQEAGPDTSRRR